MRRLWRDALLSLAVVVAAGLSAAYAAETPQDVTTGTMRAAEPIKRPDWNEIDKRLRRNHSFALVIGISEFDNASRLKGVADEVAAVSAAFAKQGFAVTTPAKNGRMTKIELPRRSATSSAGMAARPRTA